MNYINYSIIIPHYNIPHLLMRCLSSIPERNDIQIIVIDDKSPECEKYLELYPTLLRSNIEFHILNNNSGGGKARNEGMKYVKGKWVLFADSDDFYNYCFNDILNEYINNDCDIIYFNANSIDSDTYENSDRIGYINTYISQYITSSKTYENDLRYTFGEPWCKLIKYDLILKYNIKFDETPIHNDAKFSYLIGYYANKIDADNRALYCVTNRRNSVSKQLNDKLYMIRMKIFFEKFCFLHSKGILDYPLISDLIYQTLLHYKVLDDAEHYNECINIAESLGIEHKTIVDAIKMRFQKEKRWNRKVKIRQLSNTVLNKILNSNIIKYIL